MTGSVAIDVVLGLVFIFLLYSLLGSLIQEIIATNLGFRAKILEKAIGRMLDDDSMTGKAWTDKLKTWKRLLFGIGSLLTKHGFSGAFYDHPEIKYKAEDGWHKKPSQLDPQDFSKVVIDLLRGPTFKAGDNPKAAIEESLKAETITTHQIDADNNKRKVGSETLFLLRSFWADSQGDVDDFKGLLEDWFAQMMKRTTGWYKKYSQVVLLFIGLFISAIFNVDTILIVDKLSHDPKIRTELVNQSIAFVEANPDLDKLLSGEINELKTDNTKEDYEESACDSLIYEIKKNNQLLADQDSLFRKTQELLKNEINSVNDLIALGWDTSCTQEENCDCLCVPSPKGGSPLWKSLIGWLLTAFAISMGAPFWFDILNKVMKLRSSVQAMSASKEKTSKQRDPKRVG